jgi:hypothetical protein
MPSLTSAYQSGEITLVAEDLHRRGSQRSSFVAIHPFNVSFGVLGMNDKEILNL